MPGFTRLMSAAGIHPMIKPHAQNIPTRGRAFLLGAAILGWASPARSQEDLLENNIHDLDRMVVVANRTEIPLSQVGSTVDILDDSDIDNSKQPFLLDNLRFVPGFYLRNNGGPGGVFGITMRGLNANPPTVLVDGVKVDNPGDGQIINFGNLFGTNVSQVEILKGPQSSLYGANALSGVISVQTKDGREDPGSELDLSYGAHDTISASLGTRGGAGAWSYAFSGNYFDQQFSVQDKNLGPEWADDDTYENKQASLKLGYQAGEKSTFNFFAYWFDSHSDFDPGDPDSLFGLPEFVNYTETEQFFSRLGGDFTLNEQWQSSLGIAFTDVETTTVTGGSFPSFGERLRYDWKNVVDLSEAWTLVGGVEYEEEKNQTDGSDRDNTSLYLENVVHATEQFDWTIGGRYDDNSAYGEKTTGRATFSYRLGDTGGRIRGSYGTSFQAPSFFQLFSSFGDTNLSPESGEGWDIAYEQVLGDGKVFFSSTLFGNDVKDKIVFSFNSF
ncbi:MAG: TonB-dependent receptor, partial [Verrucomicrobiae bacterium]|nr:TonB-dependent receptor [Verrucomicrobiae bacterium]